MDMSIEKHIPEDKNQSQEEIELKRAKLLAIGVAHGKTEEEKIDTSDNNNLSQEEIEIKRKKLINIGVARNTNIVEKTSGENENENKKPKDKYNNWTQKKQVNITKLLHKLKYNRAINNFFFFDLKKKETFWSWIIIVLSTLSTTLNFLDNLSSEPFEYFFLCIKIILTIFSIAVTLIAAWMKNQQYVERINTIDRYNQKINKVIEEIEVQLIIQPDDREDYEIFKKKYMSLITEYLSTSPSMSPSEWKEVVINITTFYPELISIDGTDEQQLWPWYGFRVENGIMVRKQTPFAQMILNAYGKSNFWSNLFNWCCSNEKIDVYQSEINNSDDLDGWSSIEQHDNEDKENDIEKGNSSK